MTTISNSAIELLRILHGSTSLLTAIVELGPEKAAGQWDRIKEAVAAQNELAHWAMDLCEDEHGERISPSYIWGLEEGG